MTKKEIQAKMNIVLDKIADHKSDEQRSRDIDDARFEELIIRLKNNKKVEGFSDSAPVDFGPSDLDELL